MHEPGEQESRSIEDVLRRLDSRPEGLRQKEAEARREQYGFNTIEEKHTPPVVKFLSYFWGPNPLDDRGRGLALRGRSGLGRPLDHRRSASGERVHRFFPGAQGGQRHRAFEKETGPECASAPVMMIAYDRTIVAENPVRWDMHKVLTIAVTLLWSIGALVLQSMATGHG